MHFKEIISLCGAIVAAIALVSASGATTTKTHKIARIDVSSRASIVHYLRSIHVNPKGLVIQRDLRNYAGPRCPGKRWACARTLHAVVQIARPGGQNRFLCRTARCAVLQVAATSAKMNKAVCIKTTGLGASCTISQSSATANNNAVIYENAGKMKGLTQTASYTASITQQATGAANTNTACVTQAINIDGSTNASGKKSPVTVMLEAHQSVKITQDSLGSGGNSAQQGADATGTCTGSAVAQSQTLSSTVTGTGSITQLENDAISACGDGVAGDNSNMCLDIEQNRGSGLNQATGPNNATFTQTNSLTAVANTPVGQVTQTQSSSDTTGFNGGLVGSVNQYSTGISTASATQMETQCEDAATSGLTGCHTAPGDADFDGTYQLTQNQYGPEGVWKFGHSHPGRRLYGHVDKGLGTATQTGNGSDTFTINQTSKQDNDQGSNGSTSNQTNNVQGDCSTDGNCTAIQTTNENGTPGSNFQSGQNVTAQTNCTGSTCTASGGQTGGQLTVSNTDVAEFGYGGMRGSGTGSISVSGISGTVTKALLYWNGPTSSTDPTANASVTFNATPITGTNIGFASSNCWDTAGFTNSQSYRADVTSLVSGGGTYSLADFVKPNADINGVSLIVFYNDGNTGNDRNVVLWNGNDSNFQSSFDPQGWDETITGVPYPGSGTATMDFVVSDGQTFIDDALVLNGMTLVPTGGIFEGDSTPHGSFDASGDLWDVKSFDITSFLTAGSNNLHLMTGLASDCLSLVVAAANVPAPPVIGSPVSSLGPRQSGSVPLGRPVMATSTTTRGLQSGGVFSPR